MQEMWAGGRLRKFLILGYAGDVGRWQIEKILLVFIASAPGWYTHIFRKIIKDYFFT